MVQFIFLALIVTIATASAVNIDGSTQLTIEQALGHLKRAGKGVSLADSSWPSDHGIKLIYLKCSQFVCNELFLGDVARSKFTIAAGLPAGFEKSSKLQTIVQSGLSNAQW